MQRSDGLFPSDVLLFTSDTSADFSILNTDEPFNSQQRQQLKDLCGVDADQVANIRQVHGKHVVIASLNEVFEADAQITDQKGIALAVRTADCLPIFIFDPARPAVGLVHAGWRGTKEKIVCETLKLMHEEYGTNPEDVLVKFGPCICQAHYEVGAEFEEYFPQAVIKKGDKCHLDLVIANVIQLYNLGIQDRQMHKSGPCTYSEPGLFSYRRQGEKAGRMLSLIMMS